MNISYFKIVSFHLFVLLALVIPSAQALEVPKRPSGYVTDNAGMLSASTRVQIESLLNQYERKTTNQIIVVTFSGLEEEALEDFSIRLAEKWKVGQAEKNNGVILLVFRDDRKLRIEVGYGLEGALPDALAGQIINNVIVPQFQINNFEQGIIMGVLAIMKATQGEYDAIPQPEHRRGEYTPEQIRQMKVAASVLGRLVLLLVVALFFVDFFRYRRYSKGHGAYRGRYTFWEWWFRFAILLAIFSILFRILFYSMLFSRGGSYGSRGGFGGFSGGGGSFGGGGASGSW